MFHGLFVVIDLERDERGVDIQRLSRKFAKLILR